MKKLGFGLMRLPVTDGNYQNVNQEMATEMIDRFLEQGFTYFDTAYVYHRGNSEAMVKNALSLRHDRASFTIADKMPVWLVTGTADYQRYFDEQLDRCGVEYFDYYLLHALSAKAYEDTVKYGGFRFLEKMKSQGKIRHAGFSFHDKADVLDKILAEQPEVDFVQLQINYLDWNNNAIESGKCYETATKHGKPVIVMEPVKGGVLANVPPKADKFFRDFNANMSAASWAIRFAASLPNTQVVLSGMSTPGQLIDNTGYMQDFTPLRDEEKHIIEKVSGIIQGSIAIPCTACRYCVSGTEGSQGCPKNIPIPECFALYNDQKLFGSVPHHAVYYTNLIQKHGKASDCIACKRCEKHCPQHIAIAEQLKEVAKTFERA
jgi:predicted aldo/keto reductase-like oxidoreductase